MKTPDPPASRVPGRPTPADGGQKPALQIPTGTREAPAHTGDWRLATGVAHLAEVIASDSLTFEAECRQLYGAPGFGSFVRVEGREREVFGVVAHIATAAIDPGRRTQALHLPPDRLSERMPQLELVLRTCFTALVVGYRETGEIRPYLPSHPPEIHRFVHACTPAEVQALTGEPDFLRSLAVASHAPVEDLLAAAVLHAAAARGAGTVAVAFLIECGRTLATLFRREPDRFQSIMRRLQAARCTGAVPWEQPLDLA
jgi:hypothetical protein